MRAAKLVHDLVGDRAPQRRKLIRFLARRVGNLQGYVAEYAEREPRPARASAEDGGRDALQFVSYAL